MALSEIQKKLFDKATTLEETFNRGLPFDVVLSKFPDASLEAIRKIAAISILGHEPRSEDVTSTLIKEVDAVIDYWLTAFSVYQTDITRAVKSRLYAELHPDVVPWQ